MCEWTGLLERAEEKCPNCGRGNLLWVNPEREEITKEEFERDYGSDNN